MFSGLILWGLFSEITNNALNIFLDNANLLKKISFPRICLPIILIFNALINFIIIFSLFIAFLVLTNNFPGWIFITTLPLVLILVTFSIGLGVTLAVLNVFFRDVGQLFSIFINFWFWLTPIVYSLEVLPEFSQNIIRLNPLTPLITAFQQILLKQVVPSWEAILPIMILSLSLCVLAFYLFKRHAVEIVDEI